MGRLAGARVPPSYPMLAALTRDLLRRSIPVVRSARHPVRMVARRRRSSGRERFRHHADDLLGFLVDLVQESAVRDSGIGYEIDGYASITNEGTSDRWQGTPRRLQGRCLRTALISSNFALIFPFGKRICPSSWMLENSSHPSSRSTIARPKPSRP